MMHYIENSVKVPSFVSTVTDLHYWCSNNLIEVWNVSAQFQTFKFRNITYSAVIIANLEYGKLFI